MGDERAKIKMGFLVFLFGAERERERFMRCK